MAIPNKVQTLQGTDLTRLAPRYRHQTIAGPLRPEHPDSIMHTERLGLALSDPSGFVRTDLLELGETGVTLGRVTSTGHSIALREADHLTVLLPRSGRLDVAVAGQRYELYSGRAIIFRPTERVTQAHADPVTRFVAGTLQVPLTRLRHMAEAMGTSVDQAFVRDGMSLQGAFGLALARLLPQLVDDLFTRRTEPLPARLTAELDYLIGDALAELIGETAMPMASRRFFPALHRVRQAEDFMHAHSDDPVSMQDIAERLGISLRSLQLAFTEVHDGQSPRDVLTGIRMAKARSRLLAANPDSQVTSIAMDSGFYHLGRFARAYARTFGERPSETLARRLS